MIFSLRTKFIIFISVAILIFEFLFLYLSVDLYQQDKASFILENSINYTQSLSKLIGQHVDKLRILSGINLTDRDTLKLPPNLNILDFEILDEASNERKFDLDKTNSIFTDYEGQIRFLKSAPEKIGIKNEEGVILMTYTKLDASNRLISIKSDISSLVEMLKSSKIFSIYLFDNRNELISYITPDGSIPKETFVKGVSEIRKVEGAFESTILGEDYIVGYSKSPDLLVNILSTVPKKLAFEASRILIQQTLGLGLLFIGISIIVVILFSRLVTKPIIDLTLTAEKVSLGDYNQNLVRKSNDEIGILTSSFNKMIGDIKTFTLEMIKKDRIESEIMLAKNVQGSFLPKPDFKNNQISISSFYSSASECGGDWWGFQADDRYTYLFMSDATGHGLPASLLTASVSSCCSAAFFQKKSQEKSLFPSEILAIVNKVIFSTSDRMMMTMIVVRVDHLEKKLTISNASHEFPYIKKKNDDVVVLTSIPGKRLGEQMSSSYTDFESPYNEGDILLIYTDGLIENKSLDEKPFGERRLLRIVKNNESDDIKLRDIVKESYESHIIQKAPEDDVTYLFASLS